jgi:PAS domain S-box-containing protein
LKDSGWKLALIILLLGLSLSMLACSFVRQWEEAQVARELSFRSESRLVAFKSAIGSTLDSGYHVGAAIRNELVVELEHTFSGDEFASIVAHYLTEEEKLGLRNIAWIPTTHNDSGQSDGHYRVLYSLFDSSFGIEAGVDAAMNPTHREHILQAVEAGTTSVDMHRDRASHQIVSLFTPLFDFGEEGGDPSSRKLLGLVYSEWDVGELLQASQAKLPEGGLDFYLHELKPTGEQTLIYVHKSDSGAHEETESFEPVWKEDFWVAEHQWQLSSSPSPEFTRSHPVVLAWMVIVLGTLTSLSIALYVWRVSVRNELIERQVNQRTAEVQRSRRSLEETEKIAHLGGWGRNVSTGELIWSDEVYRIYGYSPKSFKPSYERLLEAVHPDDREQLEMAVNAALDDTRYSSVHRIILPDGSIRAVHEQGRVEHDGSGKAVRMVGTIQDITEQRRAERRVLRLAMALAETAESVVITNKDGVIRYVNRAFEKLSGYSADEVLGQRPNIIKSGQHPDEYYQVMWDKVTRGESWFGTFTNRNKEGGLYEVEQTISPIHDTNGGISGYVAVQRDVTGERERKAKMEHTQRLESLGILAGGIAHDFNNLLTSIMGNATLAKINTDIDKIAFHLERIEVAGEHAAELCRQMLAYSGQGEYVRENFDLNERIHDMAELLQVSLSKSADLIINVGAAPCPVFGDKSQIQQIVMNLVINASEAIDESGVAGKIELSTKQIEMGKDDFERCYHHEGEQPQAGRYVCLTVSDDGCGMSGETKVKLFDPFFTTKFTGRGLGTSAMLGIVQSHKGAIEVETELDKGTTFKVYLPVEKAGVASESPSVMPANGDNGVVGIFGKSVLLIDDETYILDIIGLMLEELGCKTRHASTAMQGIDMFATHHDEIDLVIMDMTMPEMDGLSCAKKLLEIDAEAVIVLSSGYNKEVLEERVGSMKIAGFLQKPYTQSDLRSLLDSLG